MKDVQRYKRFNWSRIVYCLTKRCPCHESVDAISGISCHESVDDGLVLQGVQSRGPVHSTTAWQIRLRGRSATQSDLPGSRTVNHMKPF